MASRCDPDTCITHNDHHGSIRGYIYHRCRCDSCRNAYSSYRKRERSEVFAGIKEVGSHGVSGYSHGCRCSLCTESVRVSAYKKAHPESDIVPAKKSGRPKLDPHRPRRIKVHLSPAVIESVRKLVRAQKTIRAKAAAKPLGRPRNTVRHGNSVGYNHDKCRCLKCRRWNAERVRNATYVGTTPEQRELAALIRDQERDDAAVMWQSLMANSLDEPKRYRASGNEYTLGELIAGGVSSIGICTRCERGSEELSDGWCPACWAQRERELRAMPTEQFVYTKPRKNVRFEKTDLDEYALPEKHTDTGQVVIKGRMRAEKKHQDDELWIGARPVQYQRGKHGLQRLTPKGHANWTYSDSNMAHSKKNKRRGDEMFTNEAWLHDGLSALEDRQP